MPSAIHLRLLGYSVTLAIHIYTFYDIIARLAVTTKDPIVADFATLQTKFITIWTFLFQITYVTLGLSCDLLTLGSGNKNALLPSMKALRETLFSALVWPTSLFIPSMFWPIYLYDNLLVFPPFIEKILSWHNNQILHTYIIFVVFWELMFLERRGRNHKLNVTLLAGYTVTYLVVLFSSFYERGSFIYPVFNRLYGTIYFPIFFIIVGLVMIFYYCIQWPLTSIFWGTNMRKKSGKKIR